MNQRDKQTKPEFPGEEQKEPPEPIETIGSNNALLWLMRRFSVTGYLLFLIVLLFLIGLFFYFETRINHPEPKLIPHRYALIANSTNTIAYFTLYDGDAQSQDAHGMTVGLWPTKNLESRAKFLVISREYADDEKRFQTGNLVNYSLEAEKRYRIKFDNGKKEWLVVDAGLEASE
jgi:hypothetical protein